MDIYFNNKMVGSTSMQWVTTQKEKKKIALPCRIDYCTSSKVKDEVRGYLIHNGSEWEFVCLATYNSMKSHKEVVERIALILESPHKDEYRINKVLQRNPNNGALIPQRPANGFAGERIDKHIQNRPWIRYLNTSYVYEVFVMNVIQYQCSAVDYIQGMNSAVRRLTDAIFLVMWDYNTTGIYPFQADFVNRIQKYSPNIIINACTKGTRKPPLQMKVETLIRNMAALYDTDYHPATIGKNIWK